MSFIPNEAGLNHFLNSTTGPVGIIIASHAERVREKAAQNASGEILGIETGDLLRGLKTQLVGTPVGPQGVVSTDALHRGFNYPAYWDQNGRPWLTNALRDEFA